MDLLVLQSTIAVIGMTKSLTYGICSRKGDMIRLLRGNNWRRDSACVKCIEVGVEEKATDVRSTIRRIAMFHHHDRRSQDVDVRGAKVCRHT